MTFDIIKEDSRQLVVLRLSLIIQGCERDWLCFRPRTQKIKQKRLSPYHQIQGNLARLHEQAL